MTSVSTRLNQIAGMTTYTVDTLNEVANTIAIDVNNHLNCVNQMGTNSGTLATEVAMMQSSMDDLDAAIKEREHDVQITHDRAAMARNPEMTRSYYDGWFPLSRPMKHYSVPILIGISIFLASLALFLFLALLGLNIDFIVYVPSIHVGSLENYGSASLFSSKPFLIMTGVSIVLLALTIYGFAR